MELGVVPVPYRSHEEPKKQRETTGLAAPFPDFDPLQRSAAQIRPVKSLYGGLSFGNMSSGTKTGVAYFHRAPSIVLLGATLIDPLLHISLHVQPWLNVFLWEPGDTSVHDDD